MDAPQPHSGPPEKQDISRKILNHNIGHNEDTGIDYVTFTLQNEGEDRTYEWTLWLHGSSKIINVNGRFQGSAGEPYFEIVKRHLDEYNPSEAELIAKILGF